MITLEPISKIGDSYILRIGDNLNQHLEPYEFSCVLHIENDIAHIKGGSGIFKPKWKSLIRNKLIELHVKYLIWERVRNDGSIHIVGPIKVRKK